MSSETAPVARFLLLSAAFVIVVAGMQAAEPILVPFLLSVFIAVIFSPPLGWMKNRGVPNSVAIVVVISAIVVVGIVIGMVVGKSIGEFRGDLPQFKGRLEELTNQLFGILERVGFSGGADALKDIINPSAVFTYAGDTFAAFGNVMTNAFMILLATIFILAEEVGFSEKLRFAYQGSDKALLAIKRFTASVNQYIAIKTALSFLTGLLVMIWLMILGVDYFILWGLLAFLLNFVPTLGSILAAVPTVLLALVQPDLGPGSALLTLAGYVVINVGVGNVLEPRITGKGLGLSALVVFLSLVFWGWVLGPVGMLLSVPLTMTVKIALESFSDTQWLGVMLSSGKAAAQKKPHREAVESDNADNS